MQDASIATLAKDVEVLEGRIAQLVEEVKDIKKMMADFMEMRK